MSHPSLPLATSALVLLCACTSAPSRALPDPLPETLAWAGETPADEGAFLGLEVRENRSSSLEQLDIAPGARVTAVTAGSPADEAGFRVGDVLLGWSDTAVADPTTLEQMLATADIASEHELEVRRGDSVFMVPVRLRGREAAPSAARLVWRADPARSRAGWLAGHGGVVLVTSDPEGPFPSAGIEAGSVVTAVDGEPFRSERALIRALQSRDPGEEIRVRFRAPGSELDRETSVELFAPPRRVIAAGVPVLVGYESSVDGDTAGSYLIDLWFISLFRYRREGTERHYSVLRFIRFSTGVGELAGGEQ